MPEISLCMIVKDEGAVLPRSLASWREMADELIVVDTGSQDATVAVAAAHGARVLHYDWRHPGHKGAARMVGIDAARGEWIVVMDADEIVRDRRALRGFLTEHGDAYDAVQVLFENYPEGELTLCWYQVRAFRRGRYRYIHREHEMPQWCGEGAERQAVLSAVFEHRPPAGRDVAKVQPMLERLHLDVAERPRDPTPLYFLHRQYVIAGDWRRGMEWGMRYLHLAHEVPCDLCECYGNMATCAWQMGDANEAVRWLCRALAEQPHRRIWWVRLAELYAGGGLPQYALAYLRGAVALPPVHEQQWEPGTCTAQLERMMAECEEAIRG